ncbi:hypothetical protein FRC00_008888, partial [Tulasnella sp. 408]
IPITAEDGSVGGFYNTTLEGTSKILYERRIQILRALGDKTALARSRGEYAQAMRSFLSEDAHKDIPFVAFYFNVVDASPKYSRDAENKYPHKNRIRVTSTLAFKIGVPEGHPAIPDRQVHFLDPTTLRPVLPFVSRRVGGSPVSTADARSLPDDSTVVGNTPGESDYAIELEKDPISIDDVAWPFFDMFNAKKPLHITDLPPSIGKGFGYRKDGWNDAPREAIVMPIAAEGDEVPIAVMVFGLNTRRPYDQAGPVQEALRMTTEPRVKEQLSLTTRNIERLQKLVDSLMDFTRVEGGRMYGRFRATNLADFTTDLAELFRNPIEKNQVKFIVTSDRKNEATAYVDHDLWEKIVFNLVGNAFKYTLVGQVHVHFKYRPGWAEFSVTDTGCGIVGKSINTRGSTQRLTAVLDNEHERVFERFHRSSLVKLHGGYITLESTPEDKDDPEAFHGSTFTVHIPLGYEHLPSANIEEDKTVRIPVGPRSYGRAVIEEAEGWNKTMQLRDDKDPSESGG